MAIVSNGKTYRNINKSARVKKLEKKLRREQRCLSRKYENLKKGESTQKNIQKQKLSDRIYHCDCGYVEDRDFNFSMYSSIFEHILSGRDGFMDTEAHTIKEDENIVTCTGRTPGALIIAGILFAYGALVLAIILCTNVLSEGVVALLILLFGDIFMIGEGVWFVLYWKNKKIIMSDSQVVYYSLTGRMWTYSWSEVRSARCIAGARGGVTIQIRTADRKFRMESGLMKGCAGAEKMLEEKGFLKNLNRAEF